MWATVWQIRILRHVSDVYESDNRAAASEQDIP